MKKISYFVITSFIVLNSLSVHSQADTSKIATSPTVATVAKPQENIDKKTEAKPIPKITYKKSTGISALYSMPIGDFGKKDINKGGFAKPGWGFAFDTRTFLGLGFSFVSYSTYSWINLDQDAMAKSFSEELNSKDTTSSFYRTTIEGGQHRPFFSTVGLGKDFYVNERIQFGLTAQLGVLYNSFKSFQMKVYKDNVLVFDDVLRYDSDFAFAYTFGAECNLFIIKDVLALHIEGNYSAAKTDTYLRSNILDPIKAVDKMQFINLNMGIVFTTK